MADITSQMNVNKLMTSDDGDGGGDSNGNIGLTENDVRKIVTRALKIYDADKTGRVDYALESAGKLFVCSKKCLLGFY